MKILVLGVKQATSALQFTGKYKCDHCGCVFILENNDRETSNVALCTQGYKCDCPDCGENSAFKV